MTYFSVTANQRDPSFPSKTLSTHWMPLFFYLPMFAAGLKFIECVCPSVKYVHLHLHWYFSTSSVLSYTYPIGPYRPLLHHNIWVNLVTAETCSTDLQKTFSSCILQQPPMWPKHWTTLNVGEKNSPCVWVWFPSSLILTVAIQCVSQAGIFSAS